MKIKFLLFVFAIALISCNENENPNATVTQVGLAFNTDALGSAANARIMGNGLTFTSGTISLKEIELEAENETVSFSIEFEQIVKLDFATGKTTPDISSLSIPAGTYKSVEVEIELHENDNNLPSVVLYGTFVDASGAAHAVRFELNSDVRFEVERSGEIVFQGGESVVAQITFDPQVWFSAVLSEHLVNATKDSSGVIVIRNGQNEEIFELVEEGLDLATDLEIYN